MLGSAAFRTGIAPGGALAGPWVRDPLWTRARAVPSLDLRFADNKSLVDAVTRAQLVTFTRASSGTFVGSDGVLRSAVTNLLLRSEEFDNASWTATRSSVTANALAAPNGTLTADQIIEDTTATNTHNIAQTISFVSGSTYTVSVFAKATASPRFLQIQFVSAAFGSNKRPVFDLVNGTAVAAVDTTVDIQSIGNGWFRCVASALATTTVSSSVLFQLANAYTVGGGSATYTGDGVSGLYLWGAQTEQASTVGEYIPTTSTINSAPRFDHNSTTGESLGLLVEEARTNVLLNSATLSTQSVTVAAAANTLSFYGTGTVTLTGVSTAGPLVGTGANNRVSLTFTPTVGVLILTVSGSVTNAQLEAGAFPTSYIPTTSATVTRAADVASVTGSAFTSFYNQTQGTVFQSFAPFSFGGSATNQTSVAFTDGTSSNLIGLTGGGGASTREHLFMRVRASASDILGTAFSPLILNLPDNTLANCSFAFAADNYGGSCNGGTPVQVSSGALPSGINTMSIMSGFSVLNGHVRRLTYWPVRLQPLQTITQP